MFIICSACNSKNVQSAKFCEHCGVNIQTDISSLQKNQGELKTFRSHNQGSPITPQVQYHSTSDKWFRSDNRILGGVIAGLAERNGENIHLYRIIFLLSVLLFVGAPLIIYFILWISIPENENNVYY